MSRLASLLRRVDPRITIAFVTILVLGLMLAMAGCAKDPIGIVSTNNYQFRVEKLFDVKGCEVFRFYDDGYYHYVTLCPNSSISDVVGCGKNCHHPRTIETKQAKPRSCNALEH